MLFWLLAILMLVVALALVLPPLLGKGKHTGRAHDEIILALYRDKLAELDTDLREDNLSQTQYDQARKELQKTVLEEMPAQAGDTGKVSITASRWPAVSVILMVPLLSVMMYLQIGNSDLISASVESAAVPATEAKVATTPDSHAVEGMVSKLALRLSATPDDIKGWKLLARSYVSMKRFGEAVLVYALLHQKLGDDPVVLADYAEAVSFANPQGLLGQRGEKLVTRALAVTADHPKSLWLAGVAAAQRSDFATAIKHWQRLSAQHAAGSTGKIEVERFIARAQKRLDTQSTATATPAATVTSDEKLSTASLQVKVSLAPTISNKVSADDTVFIFARAAQGPRMPLAIVRKQVRDLPVTIQLNDSMAMAPAFKLSNFKQVVVGARVSKSGNATPQSGDYKGGSSAVSVGSDTEIKVEISQRIP